MPKQRITDEEKAAVNARLSQKAKERWADPEMRDKLRAAQSKGTKEAWSDKDKREARLQKREARARELGFDSYGQLSAFTQLHRTAEKCGVTYDDYVTLNNYQRKQLRIKAGLCRGRKKPK